MKESKLIERIENEKMKREEINRNAAEGKETLMQMEVFEFY